MHDAHLLSKMLRVSPRGFGLKFETTEQTFHMRRAGNTYEFRTYDLDLYGNISLLKKKGKVFNTKVTDEVERELSAIEAFRQYLLDAGVITKSARFPKKFFPVKGDKVCRFNPNTDMFYPVKK